MSHPNITFTAIDLNLDQSSVTTNHDVGVALDGSVPFSIDAWIKLNDLGVKVGILESGNFSFHINGNALTLDMAGATVGANTSTKTVTDDHWHYVCVTFDGAMVRFYMDGIMLSGQSIVPGTFVAGTNTFLANGLSGFVNTIRIYKKSLSSDEVVPNMFHQPALAPSGSTQAWFDFTQNPPKDLGPGNLPVTLAGTAAIVNATPSLLLNGLGFARPINDDGVNPGGWLNDSYTVQAWVCPQPSDQRQQVIFANADLQSDTGMRLALIYNKSSNNFNVLSLRGAEVLAESLVSTNTVAVGEYSNVATTFDGTTLSIFINGVLDSTKALSPNGLWQNVGDCLIGCGMSNKTPDGHLAYTGHIAQVLVWSKSLISSEITTSMNALPDSDASDLSAIYDFSTWPIRNSVTNQVVSLAIGAVPSVFIDPAAPGQTHGAQWSVVEPETDQELADRLASTVDFASILESNLEALKESQVRDLEACKNEAEKARIHEAYKRASEDYEQGTPHFHVSRHLVDNELILVCHSRRFGNYIGHRESFDTSTACLVWEVGIFIIIILGILDLLGFAGRVSPAARSRVGKLLLNSKIRQAMYVLIASTSATAIFTVLQSLYKAGVVKEIFKLFITIGFWASLRFMGRLVSIALGIGWADYAFSLVSTLLSIKAQVDAEPSSCHQKNSTVRITLDSIGFCYDPSGASVCSLQLRKNFEQNNNFPEWVPGTTNAEQSVAAFAIGNISGKTPTIQVHLSMVGSPNNSVYIKATASSGNVLGNIDKTEVHFPASSANAHTTSAILNLSNETMTSGGIQSNDFTWTWYYKIGNASWIQLATTNHRIYVILDTPAAPWKTSRTNPTINQLPWIDVLDHAVNWAATAVNETSAATKITNHVYSNLNLTYQGGTAYILQGATAPWKTVFLCTEFLNMLAGESGTPGKAVNCTDCATIVTTFSNILGCQLTESRMVKKGNLATGFKINKTMLIGATSMSLLPNGTDVFLYHETAWSGGTGPRNHIFDACLKLNNSSDPFSEPSSTTPTILSTGMQFTNQVLPTPLPLVSPFSNLHYRERLAQNSAAGITACVPVPYGISENFGHRPVV